MHIARNPFPRMNAVQLGALFGGVSAAAAVVLLVVTLTGEDPAAHIELTIAPSTTTIQLEENHRVAEIADDNRSVAALPLPDQPQSSTEARPTSSPTARGAAFGWAEPMHVEPASPPTRRAARLQFFAPTIADYGAQTSPPHAQIAFARIDAGHPRFE